MFSHREGPGTRARRARGVRNADPGAPASPTASAPPAKPLDAQGGLAFAVATNVQAAEWEARRAVKAATPGAPPPEPREGVLDSPTAEHLGSVFGRDVRDVRMHRDSDLATADGSDALTIGSDVHVARGVPVTSGLLAHEIAHVVQQTGGGSGLTPAPVGPLRGSDPEPSGDEPLDPFVTGWSVVPDAVLVAIGADGLGLVPLRNAVYVPDAATAERFDPRIPKTPGTAPVFNIPAIGAGGTRIIPAGRKSAVIVDAGAGPGTSTAMYLAQLTGAVQRTGLSATAEFVILPIHAHRDHVDKIVELITSRGIPPSQVRIPRGLERLASMRAVVDALQNGMNGLPPPPGYGPAWRPTSPADRGSGPEVIRLEHRGPSGLRMEMVGLRSAFSAAQLPRANEKTVDRASYLTRVTHPDGTVTVIIGDPRGVDLEKFQTEMDRERPGSWARFFSGVSRVSGFSHHVGGLGLGDIRGIMSLLEVTLLATGKLEILEQTNLGQHGRARRDTLEFLAHVGVSVATAEAPTSQTPTSGVVATGRTVAAHGPDARARPVVHSELTAGHSRLVQLDEARRTLSDWRPVLDEVGQRARVDALLREIETSRAALSTSLGLAVRAAAGVRTGGVRTTAGGLDYGATGGPAGTAYVAALRAIPASTPAEASITAEGFRQLGYLRSLPLSDVPLRVAMHRARAHGEYSAQAFRTMLASLEPGTVKSLLTGPRGGRTQQVAKAFERVRAQWFTQTSAMPMPHSMSTAGFSKGRARMARGVGGGLALLEIINQVGLPIWGEIQTGQIRAKERDVYAFARRIAFWAQMGARPSVVGVEDPFFSTGPSYTRGFDEVAEGLHEKKWDAVAIESPGLSDADVLVIGAFLAHNVRNYDEYYDLFEASGQDAVRWRGQPWEAATWEIRVGHYDTSAINEVEERWEKHQRLTELMQVLVSRWIQNTREHLDIYKAGRQASEEDVALLGTFSHAENFMPPLLYRAQLQDPKTTRMTARKRTVSHDKAPHRKTFIEHPVRWVTSPVFFVHATDGDYLEVSGADFNTYVAIRPMWTEQTDHGLPYNTVSRVANETATCLLPADELKRVTEPAPPPVPVPAPTPMRIEHRIHFPFRSKEPRKDANYDYTTVLDDVAKHLTATPAAKVKIVGHTDDVGEAAFNVKLSLDRANAVKALLHAHGISSDRLTVEGGGSGAPIATNSTEDGRARNRRVEFVTLP